MFPKRCFIASLSSNRQVTSNIKTLPNPPSLAPLGPEVSTKPYGVPDRPGRILARLLGRRFSYVLGLLFLIPFSQPPLLTRL